MPDDLKPSKPGFNLALIRSTNAANPITPQPEETPGLAPLLRNRPTLNRKRSLTFLSLRKWPNKNRDSIIAAFKDSKARQDDRLARFAAQEIAATLRPWLGSNSGFKVTAPPAGVRREGKHFASVIGEEVARILGVEFRETFMTRQFKSSSFPKQDEKRGKLRLLQAVSGNWILVDDVSTSASTLEAATHTLLAGGAFAVIPVCWIYGSADNDLASGFAAPESDGMAESVLSTTAPVGSDEGE
jgi:hypothetical protein